MGKRILTVYELADLVRQIQHKKWVNLEFPSEDNKKELERLGRSLFYACIRIQDARPKDAAQEGVIQEDGFFEHQDGDGCR